jgi:hypothetical protein
MRLRERPERDRWPERRVLMLALAAIRASASREVRRGRDQRGCRVPLSLISRALLAVHPLAGLEDDTPQKEQFLITQRREVE